MAVRYIVAAIAGVAVGLSGCQGWLSAESEQRAADSSTEVEQVDHDVATQPDTDTADTGLPDTGESVGEIDPNTLDQDRLFRCEAPGASASPARLRRLTPSQYLVRFAPLQGVTPYGSADIFRYTTNAADARVDDASAEQLLLYGFLLGKRAASRRIGWGYCMRASTYEPRGWDRPSTECLQGWAAGYLKRAWQREATEEEINRLVKYAERSIDLYGDDIGLGLTASRPYLAPEFLFREELGQGEPDEHGRLRLGSWAVASAIAAAITDMALVRWYYTRDVDEHLFEPLDALRAAAESDELQTREQVEAHVRALLSVPLPTPGEPATPVLPTNIERFFREYLEHPNANFVFKNGGELPREAPYIYYGTGSYVRSMDRTIAFMYRDDEQFLERMLSTREYFLQLSREYGWVYNLADGNDATLEDDIVGMHTFPPNERAGLLTHPAWLIAHSRNQHTEPHPVHRGKWIYENMLCGAIPELPITVDAKLPDAPSTGVRERLESVTGPDANGGYCWNCHKQMDPLGKPFEMYDHYGRYRSLEKTGDGSMVPVNPATTLVSTGDPDLDGKQVADATELADLLAGSERVEGCFVRNTFRYFMGRNETYEDACTLVAMRDAYRQNNGSFQEMLITLLTSDTFLYRTPIDQPSIDETQP